MPLVPGTKLGPYEIVAPLGAGGMGEVYRAKDTRLGREVAVKVLPQHLSSNPEIRARFEREAKTVSSLNHPHICTLHDVGREGDTDFLVMELIEGETLAARLQKGALPLPDVLKFGAQIADALGRAHRAGVMHRDLKPGNIMLTRSGAKLMDFGLARASGLGPNSDQTSSPTVAGPLTAEGTILGTFQYMAPEQLEGKDADARADLWALGCVLYEMATGRRAFEGGTQASLISSIMRDAPRPMTELSPMSPPALERVVRHCLAKDPDDRIQTAHDVKLQLEGIAESGSQPSAPAVARPAAPAAASGGRERLAWIVAAVAVVAAAGLAWKLPRPVATATSGQPIRFTVGAPPHTRLRNGSDAAAISPDGTTLALLALDESGTSGLWIRELSSLKTRKLEGTENAEFPFWSPDGKSLGFFASGKLKKVGIAGGFPETLCDAANPRGGTWGAGGDILFVPQATGGIYRVAAAGGGPVEVASPDASKKETGLRFPEFLPDGKRFTFISMPAKQGSFDIHLGTLGSKDRVTLTRATAAPVWAGPDFLVTSRNRRLVAQRFDLASGKLVGEPVEIGDAPPPGGSDSIPVVSASRNGILCYSTMRLSITQLVWRDRAGKKLGVVPLAPSGWLGLSVAPDGRRAVVGKAVSGNVGEWWLVDLDSGASRRLMEGVINAPVVWSPAGDRVAYQDARAGPSDIYLKAIDGGEEPLVVSDVLFKNPSQWSPEGKYVIYEQPEGDAGWNIWRVPVDGSRTPELLVDLPNDQRGGWVSPDGRWIAYSSDESGREELWIQSIADPRRRMQATTTGIDTFAPVSWSRDGHEILIADGRVRVIDVETGATLKAGASRDLFPLLGDYLGFSATPDHQRFLVVEPVEEPEPPAIEIDLNWTAGIR